MTIRLVAYNRKYLSDLLLLFNNTIENVNRADYSQAEINEWIQRSPDLESWHERLESSYCLLAMQGESLLGFGNITSAGYLDLFYVSQAMIHQGIGRLIFRELERDALVEQTGSISTDASITAVPFFEKLGFSVIRKQANQRNGETLVNYHMKKNLILR